MRLNSIDKKIAQAMANLNPEKFEIVTHSLYHFKELQGDIGGAKTIPADMSFFQIKTGSPDDDGVATTEEDTNMTDVGKIGTGYKFWGQYVRAVCLPSKSDETPVVRALDKTAINKALVNDMGKVMNRGVVKLTVLDQPFLTIAPIMSLPSGIGLSHESARSFDTNLSSGSVASGWNVLSNSRPIDLWLAGQISFNFKVTFPAGTFKLYNNFRLGFFIDGFLARPRLA